MTKRLTNQKGFAAVEALLIVIILAIIGGTGYYVYQANNKSTDTQNAAHTATESAAVTSTTSKSAVAAGAQAKLVYANLLKAFNKNGATHKDWDVTYVDSATGSKEFTPAFKTSVDSGTAWTDGAFCSDNLTFDGFTVSKSSLSGETASVTLSPTVKGKAAADTSQIKVGLQYSSGKWVVDTHDCVAAATQG